MRREGKRFYIEYTFLSPESGAEEIEHPCGIAPNALALDALCAKVEITLLEMCAVNPLPEFPIPDENVSLT